MKTELLIQLYDEQKHQDVVEDLTRLYHANDYNWIVGYSGGKDSSLVCEFVIETLLNIKEKNKEVYIVFSDTLLEIPMVIKNVRNYFNYLQSKFDCVKTKFLTPEFEDTFWYKIIVKGYSMPNWRFRWCTDKMKIKPMDKFLKSLNKPCIVLLGARYSESSNRSRSIDKHAGLAQISKRKFTYCPIKDFATEEVWSYLLSGNMVSGYNYLSLYDLYKDGSECVFQVDGKQNSCGGSRFGCYVCTVVKNPKTNKSLAKVYEEMLPYEKLREFLVEMDRIRQERYESTKQGRFTIDERWKILNYLKENNLYDLNELNILEGLLKNSN